MNSNLPEEDFTTVTLTANESVPTFNLVAHTLWIFWAVSYTYFQ